MSDADYDVLIVGGGLVGASLACALSPTGLTIGVVEAIPLSSAAQPSYDDRTITLAYGSRRILDGMGSWAAIARHAEPVRRIHVSDRGRFGSARLDAADAGIDALGYVVASRVLGAVFYEQLGRYANITLRCPAELQSVALGEAETARVTIRENGNERVLTARLVVAADGAHSPVRAAVGIAAERVDYGQTAIVTMVTPETPHTGTAFERFTDAGPLALLPAAPDRCAVIWSMRAAEAQTALAWDDQTFTSALEERFGERLGKFVRVGKRQAYPLFLTRVREHVRPRLALIGNAAHTVHPVAGQGFNLGLRDVAALSQVIAYAAGSDIGDRTLLQRYADWRARDHRITLAATHSLIRIFSNDYLPLSLARGLGLTLIGLCPPLKRRFIRVTSGLDGRLPRLACGLPLSQP